MILLILPVTIMAQQKKYTISGTIKDKASGETLPGATVSFAGLNGTAVSTNAYGYYSISLPEGNHTLLATYTGYKTDTTGIDFKGNLQRNLLLETSSGQLQEQTGCWSGYFGKDFLRFKNQRNPNYS